MMTNSKRIQYIKPILDIILFIVSTGLLAYYSGNGLWKHFWIAFIICLGIYSCIQILNSKYILNYLEDLRNREFRYTISGLAYGLQYFYNLQSSKECKEFETQSEALITNASKLRCCSLTGTALLDSNAKKYFTILKKELLRNNKNVEIIIVNPLSKDKLLRDMIFSEAKSEAKKEFDLKYRMKNYIELTKKYKNLKILVSDYSFYCSIMLSESEGSYEPYSLSSSNIEFPVKLFGIIFSLSKGNDKNISYHEAIEKHYENVKLHSIPFEKYIENNNTELKKLTDLDLLSLLDTK